MANDVQVAYDARQAIASLGTKTPGLVLLDILLPEVDGLTLLRHMRAESVREQIPIVMISAKVSHKDRADAFFAKPITAADLKEVVGQFLP
ncbi:MAG: response regulator [Chloroflexi bacterium]|nr:response regulator [Chloroflexota bacterium]